MSEQPPQEEPDFGIRFEYAGAHVNFDSRFLTTFTTSIFWPDIAIMQTGIRKGDPNQVIVLPKDKLDEILNFLRKVHNEWQDRKLAAGTDRSK